MFTGSRIQLEHPSLTRIIFLRTYNDCIICLAPWQ